MFSEFGSVVLNCVISVISGYCQHRKTKKMAEYYELKPRKCQEVEKGCIGNKHVNGLICEEPGIKYRVLMSLYLFTFAYAAKSLLYGVKNLYYHSNSLGK